MFDCGWFLLKLCLIFVLLFLLWRNFVDVCLFEIIVCFICKGLFYYDCVVQELICNVDKFVYLICDGIFVMLVDEVCQIVEGMLVDLVGC